MSNRLLRKLTRVLVVAVIVLSSVAYSQQDNGAASEMRELEAENLRDLSEVLSRGTERIPRIASSDADVGSSTETERSEMAEKLVTIVQGFDPFADFADPESMRESLQDCVTVAAALEESGGYANWVISTALRRRSIACFCRNLFEKRYSPEEIADSFALIKPPIPDPTVLAEIMEEENGTVIELTGENEKDIERILKVGTPPESGGSLAGMERLSKLIRMDTRELMGTGDVQGMFLEQEQNDWLYRHSIAGLMEYMRRGGSIDSIPTLANEPEFAEFMGGGAGLLQFCVRGESDQLYTSHLQHLYDLFNTEDEARMNKFLRQRK